MADTCTEWVCVLLSQVHFRSTSLPLSLSLSFTKDWFVSRCPGCFCVWCVLCCVCYIGAGEFDGWDSCRLQSGDQEATVSCSSLLVVHLTLAPLPARAMAYWPLLLTWGERSSVCCEYTCFLCIYSSSFAYVCASASVSLWVSKWLTDSLTFALSLPLYVCVCSSFWSSLALLASHLHDLWLTAAAKHPLAIYSSPTLATRVKMKRKREREAEREREASVPA